MFRRNCPKCNASIYYKHEHSKNKAETNKVRCASCRNQRNLKPNCECKICHKALYRRLSKQKQNIFCSYGCRNKYYTKERHPELFQRIKRNRSSDQKRIRNKKERAVIYKGGKCKNCGYDKCIAALDFHHVNPEEKVYEVKYLMSRRWDLIKEEIDKCILLCANCHREEHWNERRKKLDNTL